MNQVKVVITGIGAVTPFGVGFPAFRAALRADRAVPSGAAPDLAEFRRSFPGVSPPWPIPLTRMALLAAAEALADAAFPAARGEVGLMVNRSRGANSVVIKALEPVLSDGPARMSPLLFSQTVPNAPLGAVSVHLGVRGPHLLTIGGGALLLASEAIRSGEAPAVLAGGMDEIDPITRLTAEQNGYLGPGTTLSDGVVLLLLERADHARARGARGYAELAAVGVGSDGSVPVLRDGDLEGWGRPTGAGLAEALADTLAEAGATPAEVGLFVGGSNGIPVVDRAEAEAARRLGLSAPRTLKAHLGEGFGMAAAASVAWAADCLHRGGVARASAGAGPGEDALAPGPALAFNLENHALFFSAVLRRIHDDQPQ
jgi:3-oxoacyl-[acyl-carrier-protein] synthase II